MGIFRQFPYTNFHDLNLDWVMGKIKEIGETVENFIINTEPIIRDEVNDWLNDHPEATTTVDFRIVRKVYGVVADMQADPDLAVGDKCQTTGYYNANDGGAANYIIVASNIGYCEPLNNGLFAQLEIASPMSILQFGAYNCESAPFSDSTQKIQNAIDYADDIFIPAGVFYVTNLTFTSGKQIKGTGFDSVLRCHANTGYILSCSDNLSKFTLDNFQIDFDYKLARGIYLARPYDDCVIRNIRTQHQTNAFIVAGTVGVVSQSLVIDNCITYTVTAGEPEVRLEGVNEANIKDCKWLRQNQASECALELSGCRDAFVRGCSFANSSYTCVLLTNGSLYNKFIGNTYEATTNYLFIIDQQSNNNLIIETPYWNATKIIKIEDASYNYISMPQLDARISGAASTGNYILSYANPSGSFIQNDVIKLVAGSGMEYNGINSNDVGRVLLRVNGIGSDDITLGGDFPVRGFAIFLTNNDGVYVIGKSSASSIWASAIHSDAGVSLTTSGTTLTITRTAVRYGTLFRLG